MGDSGLSINVTADALEFVEQKFLKLFGKDYENVELATWFRGLQQTALTQAATVHCLGIRTPLPFDSVYQPHPAAGRPRRRRDADRRIVLCLRRQGKPLHPAGTSVP
jgi:hypothetical protein